MINSFSHNIRDLKSVCVSELLLLQWGKFPQWCARCRRQWHQGPHRGRCRRCFPDRDRASSHQAVWQGQMGCHWQRCPDPAAQYGTGAYKAFSSEMSVIMIPQHPEREYLCECVTLLSSTFSFAGWVAEGKDDWALIEGSHIPDDLFSEGSSNSSHTWDTWPLMWDTSDFNLSPSSSQIQKCWLFSSNLWWNSFI